RFGMIVGIRVLQLLLFGYAINQDVRHLRAGVADLAGTQRAPLLVQGAQAKQQVELLARARARPRSRRYVRDAQATQGVEIVERARSAAELEKLLRSGAISVGLLV